MTNEQQQKPQHETVNQLIVKLEASLAHTIRTMPRGPRMIERVRVLEAAYRQACTVRDLVKLADEMQHVPA